MLPEGSPPSKGLGKRAEEVRGQSSQAVSAGPVGTAFVEAAEELPVQGMQKPPHTVGEKQFSGIFLAAPAAMVKKPAGLKTRPALKQLDSLGRWRVEWPSCLGPVVCHGIWGCQAWRP